MRTKLLCLIGAVAALTVPSTGHTAGATAQTFDTVTLEADVVVPIAAHLTITTRVRRFASASTNIWSPSPTMPATNLDDASSWIELRDANDQSLICRSAAPTAFVTADPADVITAATSEASCPLDLQATGDGDLKPYSRNAGVRGVGFEHLLEVGYSRPGTVSSARINGEDADLINVTLTRSRQLWVLPANL